MNKRTKKTVSLNEALARARKYCALSERSRAEVMRKLEELGVMKGDLQVLLEKLTNEGFLNEKRFATAFAGGKFRMKKWGRNRIKMEMKKKGLSQELISRGLSELPEKEYTATLDKLLTKKWQTLQRKAARHFSLSAEEGTKQYISLLRYALQKGYEQELVMQRIKKLDIILNNK